MQLFALGAVLIYCAVSLFMAVRLLHLAKRTRELPELMIGLAFLTGGMLGYPFNVAARVLTGISKPEAASFAHITGQFGTALAAFFLLLSWYRIFSSSDRRAFAFVVGWSSFVFATITAVILKTEPGSVAYLATPLYWSALIAQGGCYTILAWASLRHANMLKRRCAIGLADPVIANRIFVWGLSNAAISISYVYGITSGSFLRMGLPNIYHPSVVAGLGLISAVFVTLGFFPPRAYVERIRANAAHQAAHDAAHMEA